MRIRFKLAILALLLGAGLVWGLTPADKAFLDQNRKLFNSGALPVKVAAKFAAISIAGRGGAFRTNLNIVIISMVQASRNFKYASLTDAQNLASKKAMGYAMCKSYVELLSEWDFKEYQSTLKMYFKNDSFLKKEVSRCRNDGVLMLGVIFDNPADTLKGYALEALKNASKK